MRTRPRSRAFRQALASDSYRHVMSVEQNPAMLDAKTLETAADIRVFDNHGGEVRFGDIFTDSKTVIVFIRASCAHHSYMHSYTSLSDGSVCSKGHFFC